MIVKLPKAKVVTFEYEQTILNNLHCVLGVDIHHGIDMSYGDHVLLKEFRKVTANRKGNSEF